jgi:hypothetical protein
MIIIKLQGGLGNQMFQYATSKALALKHKSKITIDISPLIRDYENVNTKRGYELKIFNQIDENLISEKELNANFNFCDKRSILTSRKKVLIYNESSHNFDREVLLLKPSLYLNGYFQNEKYFDFYRNEILKIFSFNSGSLDEKNKNILSSIKNKNSISIHVRRGDYLNKSTLEFHGICDLSYYSQAIKYLNNFVDNPEYFIFSDDPSWTRQHILKNQNNVNYIDYNTGPNSWVDMFLMKVCKYNIISNSTFSWWAAWLNDCPQKIVIAPERWFLNTPTEIIPSDWIKI